MFDSLFRQYKNDVLKYKLWDVLKEIKWYYKLLLLFFVVAPISSFIFSVLKLQILVFISLGLFIGSIIILFILAYCVDDVKKERINIEDGEERMKSVLRVLIKFDIDIKDQDQLDAVISRAEIEKENHDDLKDYKAVFRGFGKYIFIPAIAVFMAEFVKGETWQNVLTNSLALISVGVIITLGVAGVYSTINDVVYSKVKKLDRLILDIKDIKTFPDKAHKLYEIVKNE